HIFLSSNRVQTNIDLVAKNEGISFILDAVDLKAYATRALIKFIEDYIKEHFTIK
ncbi:LysR family transcriptional regulator, partial [Salmonella enterica subsp. enterica serovar Typhimurium]